MLGRLADLLLVAALVLFLVAAFRTNVTLGIFASGAACLILSLAMMPSPLAGKR